MTNQQVRQSPRAEPRFFYGYIVVVVALLIMMVVFGVNNAFGIFLNPLLAEFGWTRAMTSGAFSLAWIVQGSLGIILGTLTDRLGPRLVLTFCGFVLGLGYLLIAQTHTIWQLYLFYGLIIGAGLSGGLVPLVSTMARWFVQRRSMMTGIVVNGIGIGVLITPPVANWLVSTYDWRLSYIILGSIVLAVVVLAAQFLRRDPAKVGQRPYGESEGEEPGLKLGTMAFSLKEAVYTRQFWLVFAVISCGGFCRYSIMVHIAPHATEMGISAASAANVLATIGGMSIIGRVVLGCLADRIGNKQVYTITLILMLAALLWLMTAIEEWMFYLFAIVFGLAFGGNAVESPLVAQLFGLRSHGSIFGVMALGFTIGAAAGPFVTGYLFDVTNRYQGAFVVCAAIAIIGLILTALLTPIRHHSCQDGSW